jgi:hypothetical protein
MTQTLTISDTLFYRLRNIAKTRGLDSVEALLEQWQAEETEDLRRRQEVVLEISRLRERLDAKYGLMPDSTLLIREDRER